MAGHLPRHVAVIMDGNGRWAGQRDLPRWVGHWEGMKAVREVVEGSCAAGVEILTLYAFSTQNWNRPREEIDALMGVLQSFAEQEREPLAREGVQVSVLGEVERLDGPSRDAVRRIVETTRNGDRLRLNLLISYGAREEILGAARALAKAAAAGLLEPESIDEEAFRSALLTGAVPDPDLLVRTSGEFRISNFMLWQLAYTEFHVTPVLWPDFTREDLFAAILDYQSRDRRFGRVKAL